MTRRHRKLLIVSVLLLHFSLPLILWIVGLDVEANLTEKRQLSRFPDVPQDIHAVLSWSDDVNEYVADNIPMRDAMIRVHAKMLYSVFREPVAERAIIGRDGWLFTGSPYLRSYFDFDSQPTVGELAAYQLALESKQRVVESWGGRYALILVPTKASVYPEYLPGSVRLVPYTPREYATSHLAEHCDLLVIDVTETLRREKANQEVYFRADAHWNAYGGFRGYETIYGALTAAGVPMTAPVRLADIDVGKRDIPSDLAALMGLPELYEKGVDLYKIKPDVIAAQPPATGPAIALSDSFFVELEQYFRYHYTGFSRVMAWWLTTDRDAELQERRPVLVLEEVLERSFLPHMHHTVARPADFALPGHVELWQDDAPANAQTVAIPAATLPAGTIPVIAVRVRWPDGEVAERRPADLPQLTYTDDRGAQVTVELPFSPTADEVYWYLPITGQMQGMTLSVQAPAAITSVRLRALPYTGRDR